MTKDLISRLEAFDLRCVRAMVAVAESGSFRKASRSLGIGQSAVSRRVGRLEDTLGVSLFERGATGAQLTRAGWRFFKMSGVALADLYRAIESADRAGSGELGQLSIGLTTTLCCGAARGLVSEYVSENPDVELAFIEAERRELFALLSHRALDCFIGANISRPACGEHLALSKAPLVLAVAREHKLSTFDRLHWSELKDIRFLVSADGPGPEIHEFLVAKFAGLGSRVTVETHRIGREGLFGLVGLGLGCTLVAGHWRDVGHPGLAFIPVGDDDDDLVSFSLVWEPKNDNPALRRFVSLARVHARKTASDGAASQRPDPSP